MSLSFGLGFRGLGFRVSCTSENTWTVAPGALGLRNILQPCYTARAIAKTLNPEP